VIGEPTVIVKEIGEKQKESEDSNPSNPDISKNYLLPH